MQIAGVLIGVVEKDSCSGSSVFIFLGIVLCLTLFILFIRIKDVEEEDNSVYEEPNRLVDVESNLRIDVTGNGVIDEGANDLVEEAGNRVVDEGANG